MSNDPVFFDPYTETPEERRRRKRKEIEDKEPHF